MVLVYFRNNADNAADWKLILDTILKPVGGPYLLNCNFDLESFPVVLGPF